MRPYGIRLGSLRRFEANASHQMDSAEYLFPCSNMLEKLLPDK